MGGFSEDQVQTKSGNALNFRSCSLHEPAAWRATELDPGRKDDEVLEGLLDLFSKFM